MAEPLFIATERFDPSDGEVWQKYFAWAEIPALTEVVSLDGSLCNRLGELSDYDWEGNVWKRDVKGNFSRIYFGNLDDLLNRVRDVKRKNILGMYRNPDTHISDVPAVGDFIFMGYDLIDEETQTSALVNCGGFPDVFSNEELNNCGLIGKFERALEVKRLLAEKYPKEAHAQCEMYAIWRLVE